MTGTPKDLGPDFKVGRKAKDGGLSGIDFAAIPFQLAMCLLAGVYAGQWLDKKLGSAPWLLLIGVFVGAGLGFYSIYVKLMAAQARDESEQKSRRDGQP
jgi:F0F1-type ATP synthase assembly protein I